MAGTPETHYAPSADTELAYQTVGDGPFDLVFIPSWDSNIEVMWEEPALRRFLERLASFSRLICFDKRGTGASGSVAITAIPTLEEWSDDVAAVLDAAGSERAAVFGHAEGGQMAAFFAASHPERTSGLVLADAFARLTRAPDYPCGLPESLVDAFIANFRAWWGTEQNARFVAPSADLRTRRWYARLQRLAMTPTMAAASYGEVSLQTDVRPILATIRVPTLVLHRAGDPHVRACHGHFLAEHIPGARYVEIDGDDHLYWLGHTEAVLDAVEHFLTGRQRETPGDRVLATVLFTDLVDSTRQAAALGDRRWRQLLDRHDVLASHEVSAGRGQIVKTTGDGLLATFDGPARAIRCAARIRDAVRDLGVEVRAGVHTGEVELRGQDIGGIAVHIGQRVSALAGPGEVLVSRTVTDLVAGSGIEFADRGEHELKGVPGTWRLFVAAP
ncbi:MAG: adenylate/guanylate cyclase domain-containing protein [Acidimicrobiia bacterium]|nr:adenylate/guanylate cyclase domain-containing protein [Acidimicrobiia bacterium]